MKRVTILLHSSETPIVFEGRDAGYSVKEAGNNAYVTAWENRGSEEYTEVIPFEDVKRVQFSFSKG